MAPKDTVVAATAAAPGTAENPVSWEDFLADYAPPVSLYIGGVAEWSKDGTHRITTWPFIELHCSKEICGGMRLFEKVGSEMHGPLFEMRLVRGFVTYRCRNCGLSTKVYALNMALADEQKGIVYATKLGEDPFFGPPVPPGLRKFLGPDAGMFFKGRQSENLGLGIGAFTYYRRVLDGQKNRLIDEILKVARATKATQAVIDTLARAKTEADFSRSMEIMKDAVPDILLYDGHNPMMLLQSALSNGLHAQTDQECLESAGTIRSVLEYVAERMAQALTKQTELDEAVSKLMRKHEEKKKRTATRKESD